MSRLSLLLLSLIAGCSPDGEGAHPYVPPREGPETKAFKDRTTATIQAAKGLQLLDRCYISDGGSVVFTLKSDTGTTIELQALHHNVRLGGSHKGQVFLIYSSLENTEFELTKGSSLEKRLVVLLEQCGLGDETPSRRGWAPATSETRRWLLDRIKNRSLPFDSCP